MSHAGSKGEFAKHSLLALFVIVTYYPFAFVVFTSFKDLSQFYTRFWLPSFPLHIENYTLAWSAMQHYIGNSFFITTVSVVGVLIVSSLSAFIFARYAFPLKKLLFNMVVALLMVPPILTLVPGFVWMKQLHLLNTYWVLILPYIAGHQVLAIFILRSFFAAIPEDLFEAARVDGATMFQMYRIVALPLSRPILGVIAIMSTLSIWNDYVWPLVTISDDSLRTITIGLAYFQGQFFTNYGPLMAGYVIASLPLLVLFFFTMRHFMQGLASGAIKM